MKCILALINAKTIDCLNSECVAWDSDHNTCLIRNYLLGYINQQRITVEMLKVSQQLQKRIDED